MRGLQTTSINLTLMTMIVGGEIFTLHGWAGLDAARGYTPFEVPVSVVLSFVAFVALRELRPRTTVAGRLAGASLVLTGSCLSLNPTVFAGQLALLIVTEQFGLSSVWLVFPLCFAIQIFGAALGLGVFLLFPRFWKTHPGPVSIIHSGKNDGKEERERLSEKWQADSRK